MQADLRAWVRQVEKSAFIDGSVCFAQGRVLSVPAGSGGVLCCPVGPAALRSQPGPAALLRGGVGRDGPCSGNPAEGGLRLQVGEARFACSGINNSVVIFGAPQKV